MGVSYAGYWDAYSGMGEACRNFVVALDQAGVDVTTELVPNMRSKMHLGFSYDTCERLHGVDVDYKVKIIHTTPDCVTKSLEPLKYHIFHLFWETSELPEWWVWALNLVDEVWTGSEWNKKIFIDSGVKKPIYVFPQPIDTGETIPSQKLRIYGEEKEQIKDFYWFYSIFQWIERKDPKTLLKAFWKEFEGVEDVGLVMKTYKEKFSNEELQDILKDVVSWKKELNLTHFPKVGISHELMSRDKINKLHHTGDCFVSAHRGEGWGIPIVESMLMNNPVISTNLGGVHEYIPRNAAKLISYKTEKVHNMDFVPWYEQRQEWGAIDENELRKAMRWVYENKEEAREMGDSARRFVKTKFSYQAVGKLMAKRLDEIEKSGYYRPRRR